MLYLSMADMRRAQWQAKFESLEIRDGRIWGKLSSKLAYNPFNQYETGLVPHLSFASAKDPEQWHRQHGPLFRHTTAYSSTVEEFQGAQQRFLAVLKLWQAWKDNRQDLSECYLRVVQETGHLIFKTAEGPKTTVAGLNPEWEAESKGEELPSEAGNAEIMAVFDPEAKRTFAKAQKFVNEASHKDLRMAAEELLKLVIASRLKGVQPDFRDQMGFEASWDVRDFLQACYLMLFFDVTKRRGIRDCEECGQYFYPTRKRTQFCSTDCARRNRQRRYWKRKGSLLRLKRRREQ
jgi:hypothetical protein